MATKGCFDILVYHRIGRENSFDGLTVSNKIFIEQMQYIRHHYRPLSLGELVQTLLEKGAIPSRAVAVTFDDGYADTFKIAFPILKRAKIPATVFVTTGYVDQELPSFGKAPMLSWGMIKKMQRAGIEIGAHTLTHPNLTQCSLREVKRQMIGSRNRLEEKLNKPVRLFAYPYGGARSFNQAIQACARQAGFLGACTTLSGSNGPGTDPYALRRMSPLRDEIHDLAVQLDRATRKRSLNHGPEIRGVTKRAAQIWGARYKRVSRRLSRKSPFYWRMDRPFGS